MLADVARDEEAWLKAVVYWPDGNITIGSQQNWSHVPSVVTDNANKCVPGPMLMLFPGAAQKHGLIEHLPKEFHSVGTIGLPQKN